MYGKDTVVLLYSVLSTSIPVGGAVIYNRRNALEKPANHLGERRLVFGLVCGCLAARRLLTTGNTAGKRSYKVICSSCLGE
ncbi:hypothetical protein O3P69_002588 [Scylla paramamosain]|uniref:Uncharacterized protein n=1 Tax=Scylla paramamosain TaxID=85552 RepID=A0AAW0ULB4_SCYPA